MSDLRHRLVDSARVNSFEIEHAVASIDAAGEPGGQFYVDHQLADWASVRPACS
jgi:hypothetical protein